MWILFDKPLNAPGSQLVGRIHWILNAWVGDMYKAFMAMWHAQKRFCRKQETEHPRRWSNMSMQFFCPSYSIKRFPGCWNFVASHSSKTTKATCSFWSTTSIVIHPHPVAAIYPQSCCKTDRMFVQQSIEDGRHLFLLPFAGKGGVADVICWAGSFNRRPCRVGWSCFQITSHSSQSSFRLVLASHTIFWFAQA